MKKQCYLLLRCALVLCGLAATAPAGAQQPPGSTLNYYCQPGASAFRNRFSNDPVIGDDSITVTEDVVYRIAKPWNSNTNKTYKMDLYYPDTMLDPMVKRPCILLLYGGGFIAGKKEGVYDYCMAFARRGYVAVAIDYRLGKDTLQPCKDPLTGDDDPYSDEKAQYRATQDADSAMRFLVRYARKYKIDTSWLFAGGFSAGAGIANGLVYADQDEIDAVVPGLQPLLGPLKGHTYPYTIKGIFNNWGAISADMYDRDQAVPMVAFHGTNDGVVPYRKDIKYGKFVPECGLNNPILGSAGLADSLDTLGICYDLTLFKGAGHGIWPDGPAYDPIKDSGLVFRVERAACFFKKIMCGSDCGQVVHLVEKAYRDSSTHWVHADCTPFLLAGQLTGIYTGDGAYEPISLYPNPAQGYFRIGGISQLQQVSVHVYDGTGRLIQRTSGIQATGDIPVRTLQPGIYHVTIEDGIRHYKIHRKLVIR